MIRDYDWFLSAIQLARLTSITYTALFTTGFSSRPEIDRLASVQDVRRRLEEWRLSVPMVFRPKEPFRVSELETPTRRMIAIETHYLYYHIVFGVERVSLLIDFDGKTRCGGGKSELINAARSVIDLLRWVDVGPHMPVLLVFSLS
jgi:hypothetical protein